ncbi:hypothetical protein BN1708_017724, partial [Verticillium longisporum]
PKRTSLAPGSTKYQARPELYGAYSTVDDVKGKAQKLSSEAAKEFEKASAAAQAKAGRIELYSGRQNVVNYPPYSPSETPNGDGTRPKVQVSIRPPMKKEEPVNPAAKQKVSASEAMRRRQAANLPPVPGQPGLRPEDRPDAPEYKKKQAMIKGPVVELNQENADPYGMSECTFTGLKDIFGALMQSED